MEGHCLSAVCEFLSRKLFIVTFGLSTFFELTFGIPSFVFVILPFLISSLFDGNFSLLLSTLSLSATFICSISGLIAFILHLTGRNKQIRKRLGDDWYQLKTYDNFNSIVLLLLGLNTILEATTGYDAFLAVAENIYYSQMYGYQDINSLCLTDNTPIKSNADSFLDELHERYKCCGWNGPVDWSYKFTDETRLAHSCCSSMPDCGDICSNHNENHFVDGCKQPFVTTLRKFDTNTYSTGALYFLIKVIAYITYCSTYKSVIEKHKETTEINDTEAHSLLREEIAVVVIRTFLEITCEEIRRHCLWIQCTAKY
ncbi:hypothetical protein B4U80_13854 [Leptotrombidium deliense]|uniref:Uncharacterized protein n=1 Tax=Leptotrombidium deliense TaxID=299467 RepID=A0A443SB73_9ACAR|nr:hypothetical protein B4U80_13854 [Leptotrombidium deliense]